VCQFPIRRAGTIPRRSARNYECLRVKSALCRTSSKPNDAILYCSQMLNRGLGKCLPTALFAYFLLSLSSVICRPRPRRPSFHCRGETCVQLRFYRDSRMRNGWGNCRRISGNRVMAGSSQGTRLRLRMAVNYWEPQFPISLIGDKFLITAFKSHDPTILMSTSSGGSVPLWWRNIPAEYSLPLFQGSAKLPLSKSDRPLGKPRI